MKKTTLVTGGTILLIVAAILVYPANRHQKDKWITVNLELKVVPFLVEKKIEYFSDKADCKQIRYEIIEAASPQGCAFISNVTDDSKKTIPDFSAADKTLFEEFRDILHKATPQKFVRVGTEHTSIFDPRSPLPSKEIGIGFHADCFFCRTRYVYWPKYQSLPPDMEGQIRYVPINENWYRIEED